MDRLEDQVRRALAAGALSADPDLVDVDAVHRGITTRRRRRAALAGALAVVAVVGVGSAVLAAQRPDTSAPDVLAQPTATADPTPTAAPTPSPTVSSARECERADLTLVGTEQEGAAGHVYTTATVRNDSSSACTLSGSPGFSFAGTGGGGEVRGSDTAPFNGRTPATVDPGAVAYASIDAAQGCPGPARSYRRIELVLKDGRTLRLAPTVTATCPLVVSPWYLAATP